MKSRVRLITVASGFAVATLAAGCAMQEKQTMESLDQPINCATAEGDIRVLQGEKTHVAQQIASGVTAIAPAGIVLGACFPLAQSSQCQASQPILDRVALQWTPAGPNR